MARRWWPFGGQNPGPEGTGAEPRPETDGEEMPSIGERAPLAGDQPSPVVPVVARSTTRVEVDEQLQDDLTATANSASDVPVLGPRGGIGNTAIALSEGREIARWAIENDIANDVFDRAERPMATTDWDFTGSLASMMSYSDPGAIIAGERLDMPFASRYGERSETSLFGGAGPQPRQLQQTLPPQRTVHRATGEVSTAGSDPKLSVQGGMWEERRASGEAPVVVGIRPGAGSPPVPRTDTDRDDDAGRPVDRSPSGPAPSGESPAMPPPAATPDSSAEIAAPTRSAVPGESPSGEAPPSLTLLSRTVDAPPERTEPVGRPPEAAGPVPAHLAKPQAEAPARPHQASEPAVGRTAVGGPDAPGAESVPEARSDQAAPAPNTDTVSVAGSIVAGDAATALSADSMDMALARPPGEVAESARSTAEAQPQEVARRAAPEAEGTTPPPAAPSHLESGPAPGLPPSGVEPGRAEVAPSHGADQRPASTPGSQTESGGGETRTASADRAGGDPTMGAALEGRTTDAAPVGDGSTGDASQRVAAEQIEPGRAEIGDDLELVMQSPPAHGAAGDSASAPPVVARSVDTPVASTTAPTEPGRVEPAPPQTPGMPAEHTAEAVPSPTGEVSPDAPSPAVQREVDVSPPAAVTAPGLPEQLLPTNAQEEPAATGGPTRRGEIVEQGDGPLVGEPSELPFQEREARAENPQDAAGGDVAAPVQPAAVAPGEIAQGASAAPPALTTTGPEPVHAQAESPGAIDRPIGAAGEPPIAPAVEAGLQDSAAIGRRVETDGAEEQNPASPTGREPLTVEGRMLTIETEGWDVLNLPLAREGGDWTADGGVATPGAGASPAGAVSRTIDASAVPAHPVPEPQQDTAAGSGAAPRSDTPLAAARDAQGDGVTVRTQPAAAGSEARRGEIVGGDVGSEGIGGEVRTVFRLLSPTTWFRRGRTSAEEGPSPSRAERRETGGAGLAPGEILRTSAAAETAPASGGAGAVAEPHKQGVAATPVPGAASIAREVDMDLANLRAGEQPAPSAGVSPSPGPASIARDIDLELASLGARETPFGGDPARSRAEAELTPGPVAIRGEIVEQVAAQGWEATEMRLPASSGVQGLAGGAPGTVQRTMAGTVVDRTPGSSVDGVRERTREGLPLASPAVMAASIAGRYQAGGVSQSVDGAVSPAGTPGRVEAGSGSGDLPVSPSFRMEDGLPLHRMADIAGSPAGGQRHEAIGRLLEDTGEPTGSAEGSSGVPKHTHELDMEQITRSVWQRIRRELKIERERSKGRA